MDKYNSYTDEALITMYRQGDMDIMEYLLEKYKPLVLKKTNKLFLIGAETEDLIQEGMVGLFKAIRDYRDDHDASFYTFAALCINRQMITALEASNRKKHMPLNSYVSISVGQEEGGIAVEELLKGESLNPEELVIEKEIWKELQRKLEKELSTLERQVLQYYLEGINYTGIAERMGKEPQSIHNAIQRIRNNMKSIHIKTRVDFIQHG